ncbi:MAG: hypothetical protein Q8M65_03590 [Rhodoglobus sp.]|nr:hypothetical protein [Rhodoglobus sp.]
MKALFYSPFANIWEHSFPEALVAESFAKHGVDVVAVRCGSILKSHCVAMSAAAVGPSASLQTRQQVCKACFKRRDLLTREFALPAIILDDRLEPADFDSVDRLMAGTTREGWTDLEVDGIPLGRYAVYEMWLNNKLVSTNFSTEMWELYLGQLRNTLVTYFAAKRILAAEKPDVVLVYNDHYSVNHAFVAAAQRVGVASYTVHGGAHMVRRSESMSILASGHTMEDIFRSAAWQQYRDTPIGATEVDLVGDHFSGLLEASSAFVYSSKFEGTDSRKLREQIGIREGASVLLATMSSEDELIGVRLIDAIPDSSSQENLFADQFEWVDYLLGYARDHPDVHLVLRLHPRMFPNKRENVLSPVASQVMALRDTAPANVTFNMPSDGIGLYDLMQVVDVLLNFRSTVGAELSAFGLPVVVPSNSDFFTYPNEINKVGHTLEQYRNLIEAALTEGWSIENARRSFRWFAFQFSRLVVDFSDAISSRPIAIRPRKPGLRLWVWKKLVYLLLQHGPLIRERLALRSRTVADGSQQIMLDVVMNHLNSTSESGLWPGIDSNLERETELLESYLLRLCDTLWVGIDDPASLAGRVRAGVRLQTRPPA